MSADKQRSQNKYNHALQGVVSDSINAYLAMCAIINVSLQTKGIESIVCSGLCRPFRKNARCSGRQADGGLPKKNTGYV